MRNELLDQYEFVASDSSCPRAKRVPFIYAIMMDELHSLESSIQALNAERGVLHG